MSPRRRRVYWLPLVKLPKPIPKRYRPQPMSRMHGALPIALLINFLIILVNVAIFAVLGVLWIGLHVWRAALEAWQTRQWRGFRR